MIERTLEETPLQRALPRAPRLARQLLRRLLSSRFRQGALTVLLPDGERWHLGDAGAAERATIEIGDDRFFLELLLGGEMAAGEAYMDGLWRADDLPALLRLFMRNFEALDLDGPLQRLVRVGDLLQHLGRRNDRPGARRNIAAHYDLGNDFYRLFLDETLAYSCAVFPRREATLAEAQREKFARLVAKLGLRAGDRLLEIGSGWGGFALYAARTTGCHVTTVTISEQQYAYARELIAREGLTDRVQVRLCDYRNLTGRFDKLVSIEMFEAVGAPYFAEFFAVCDRLLAPGGVMAMQTIALPDQRFARYVRQVDWMRKYIFPGGCLPSLGALSRAMAERSQLTVRAVEDIGPHYAPTLRLWRERFLAQLPAVRRLGFDERFLRMWELYLAFSEAAFAEHQLFDYQLVLARPGSCPPQQALPR